MEGCSSRPTPKESLSERDIAIMRFMLVHGSTAGVARALRLSERHTRRIVRDLLIRLDLPNTHALTAWAAIEGLIWLRDASEDS